MGLDAIIIADSSTDSMSGTSALRLHLDGKEATIQNIIDYIHKQPLRDDGIASWSSTLKLNGIFLYSYLSRHGFDVALINNFEEERERFVELSAEQPAAIIISSTFIMNKEVLRKLVADIRSILPHAYIIAGGAYINISYMILQRELASSGYLMTPGRKDYLFQEINEEPAVDLYIASLRGESILTGILDNLKKRQSIGLPANSARLDGAAYVFGERVDDLSKADPILTDWDSLPETFFKNKVVPMQASNGCSFHCSFCSFTKNARMLQITPLDRLISDLKTVERRGVKYVWFVDDNFRLGKNDLNTVCRRIINEGINLRWMSFIRASTLIKTDPDLLKKAGCVEVQLGLESGDDQVLHNMNKKAKAGMYANVVETLLRHGINCSCYFLFGFPGETDESAQRTLEFIRSIEFPKYDGVLTWSLFPFILTALSPIYEDAMRNQYKLKGYWQDWEHPTMNYTQARNHVVKTFFELKQSSILYRGDNQDIYLALAPSARKAFVSYRHECTKLSLMKKLDLQKMEDTMRRILA